MTRQTPTTTVEIDHDYVTARIAEAQRLRAEAFATAFRSLVAVIRPADGLKPRRG